MSKYVIRLRNGEYYIGKSEGRTFDPPVLFATASIDAASKYETRWQALQTMSQAGADIMANAAIIECPNAPIDKDR